jgi:hypothetical protein
MTRPIRLFVSSSPDVEEEREAVGRAAAELPVSTGWVIKHTARAGEDLGEVLTFIERCDVYVVVLGADFAAPMGLEWEHALRADRPPWTYRKRGLHSPSARKLLQRSKQTWTDFQSPGEFKGHVTKALVKLLLDHGERFGLKLGDVEVLMAMTKKPLTAESEEPDRRRGAGESGVILSNGD